MFFVLSILNTPLFLTYQYTDIGYLGKVLYSTETKDLKCEPDYYISEIKESKCETIEDQCLFLEACQIDCDIPITYGCRTDQIEIPYIGQTILKIQLGNFIVVIDILSILVISFFLSMLP